MEVKGETGGRVIELDGECVTAEIELLDKKDNNVSIFSIKKIKNTFHITLSENPVQCVPSLMLLPPRESIMFSREELTKYRVFGIFMIPPEREKAIAMEALLVRHATPEDVMLQRRQHRGEMRSETTLAIRRRRLNTS